MDYIRAAEILPQELIEQLQQYADGAVIYIPKKEEEKKAWGEQTTTKKEFARKNTVDLPYIAAHICQTSGQNT